MSTTIHTLIPLPPGLTKAGIEEKEQLKNYIKEIQEKRQTSEKSPNQNHNTVGNQPVQITEPSLNLLSKEYKRPLTMYDLQSKRNRLGIRQPSIYETENKPYQIYPPLRKTANTITPEPTFEPTQYQSPNYTAGKSWNKCRYQMWCGGTDGSVESRRITGPAEMNYSNDSFQPVAETSHLSFGGVGDATTSRQSLGQ